MAHPLPTDEVMYTALVERDLNFEGIFIVGVKTTGIFCRPGCTARKPKKENVEFFSSTKEAILRGYRPCKMCNPLQSKGEIPIWLEPLLNEIEENPGKRIKDWDIRQLGIDPSRVRRWFKKHHGMTFQTYLRTLRIGEAFGRIKHGDKIIDAAFESSYESLSGFGESFKNTMGVSPNKSLEISLVTITRILTPLGPMLAGATDKGICLLEFVDRRMIETQLKKLTKLLNCQFVPGNHPLLEEVQSQIQSYFAGTLKEFTIPLDVPGTEFQQKVWQVLQSIPYGTTCSYQEQAEILGSPNSVRAVANANGINRIGIIIPCHRVIGKNGKLTGYGGGLWRKKYLLDLETKSITTKSF